MTTPKINPAAIDLIARYFNSHKKGLPELLKNAREAYLGANENNRHIVINYMRDTEPKYLECVDFVGISGSEIEKRYLEWAKPDAGPVSSQSGQSEGGQGNGGKAYLRQLFDKGYFISICDGQLSVVGFADVKKYVLDFLPNVATGKDSTGDNSLLPRIRSDAAWWLRKYGLPLDHNITIVRGVTPKKPIDVERLLTDIQQFPQARETLRTCDVEFYVNRIRNTDLKVVDPRLHADFPEPITIAIPKELTIGSYKVKTCAEPTFPSGQLALMVASKPLVGQALGSWNQILFYGTGVSNFGSKNIQELQFKFPQHANHVYGKCTLPFLDNPDDRYVMQGRGQLNDGLLSRAIYTFITEEADKILEKLAKSLSMKVATKKRKNLEKLNSRLVTWLESQLGALSGLSSFGDANGVDKRVRKKRQKKTHEPAALLKVHKPALDICLGVNVYDLRAVAYDADNRPVPPGEVSWHSNDSVILNVNPQTGRLEPRSVGQTTVTVANAAGLKSLPVIVSVHEAASVRIKASSPAQVGSNRRLPLNTVVKTTKGKTVKNLALAWRTTDRTIVTVGQDGTLVGGAVGEAVVVAGAGAIESDPLEVEVERGTAGLSKGGGNGRPQMLLSGQNICPFDHTQVLFDPTDPPVHQRAYKPDYENNVFWINLQHPLAEVLLNKGEESVRWRSYHFERLIDVFITIEVRRKFTDNKELDADALLDEINVIKTNLYTKARDELFDVLYDEGLDFANLVG